MLLTEVSEKNKSGVQDQIIVSYILLFSTLLQKCNFVLTLQNMEDTLISSALFQTETYAFSHINKEILHGI